MSGNEITAIQDLVANAVGLLAIFCAYMWACLSAGYPFLGRFQGKPKEKPPSLGIPRFETDPSIFSATKLARAPLNKAPGLLRELLYLGRQTQPSWSSQAEGACHAYGANAEAGPEAFASESLELFCSIFLTNLEKISKPVPSMCPKQRKGQLLQTRTCQCTGLIWRRVRQDSESPAN